MRGKLGPILSGVGGFLLVFGVLLNVYAYPRLAVAPLDQDGVSTLTGPNAKVFDIESLETIDTNLTTTAQVTGDVKASEDAGDNVRVWVNSTSTKSEDGVVRSRSIDRFAFDAHTGKAVDCDKCGTYSETTQGQPEAVPFEGQIVKFPFQTKKQDYLWWDGTLRRAIPAKFDREEAFRGIDTYVFVQDIPAEVWTQMEVPGSVVNEPEASVVADRAYSNKRTFWVEPETGVVLNRIEEQGATLQVDGEDRAILTEVVTEFSEETIQAGLDEYASKPAQLKAVRLYLPLVLGIAGLVLLLGGLLLARRQSAPADQY